MVSSSSMARDMRSAAPIVLRIGMALVFLWFGSQQLMNAGDWVGYVPEWATSILPVSSIAFVLFNGVCEVAGGIALILGLWTRLVALLLTIHMALITMAVGYNTIGVRDFGLTVATCAVFLFGKDSWSIGGRS